MLLNKLNEQVSAWPHVSAQAHRFGGKEFRVGNAEVGHVHNSGEVDIPFPRAFHDELLARGLAEQHRWAPNTGWVTFRVRGEADIERAAWLMRLSYLRYALKAAVDPHQLLEEESKSLRLDSRFRELLGRFVPSRTQPAHANKKGAPAR
ncbi:MAG TPA: luciferase family protein [Xanthobacteraceae bacterium]|nr:luciferase family protein [Xanthobacteraceae bacterium]